MEIRITKIGQKMQDAKSDPSDVTSIYRVVENGKEFRITFRSHLHGSSLGIDGQKGFLYTDPDDNTVHRQVLAISEGCGLRTETDEIVNGLSPLSVRFVIYAQRNHETKEILITDELPECIKGKPVVLIGNKKVELLTFM